jgi:hypothetical protein
MTDWVKAMNPTSQATTEGEALAAARASAIAMFLGALWGVVGILYFMSAGEAAMAAALSAQSTPDAPDMSGMAGMMSNAAIGISAFFVVLQLILGFVQWTKPNKVLPILFIVLVVYGIGSALVGQMMAGQMDMPAAAATPMWLTTVGYVVMVVELVLHIAGVRGVGKLDEIRTRMAQ